MGFHIFLSFYHKLIESVRIKTCGLSVAFRDNAVSSKCDCYHFHCEIGHQDTIHLCRWHHLYGWSSHLVRPDITVMVAWV